MPTEWETVGMTFQHLPAVVASERAHAGDLVGYDKWGRPMFLPGGGARDGQILAGPDDDDDPDGADDGDDEDGDEGEDDEEPAAPAARKNTRPSYKELMEQIKALREQVDPESRRKANSEAKKNRLVRQWTEKHGIADLDAWLEERGIDKETGQPKAKVDKPAGDEQKPAEPAPAADPEDFDRKVELEVERRLAADGERSDLLLEALRVTAVESQLNKLGFSGTIERALRVLDLDSISVDDEGRIVGAQEVAEGLKTEIPEWFRGGGGTGRPPRQTGGADVDGGDKPARPPKKPGWDQQIVNRLTTGRS